MKEKDLSRAYSISQHISKLQIERDLIADGAGLNVTIQSTYQDDTFVDAIRPHALAELDRRIEEQRNTLADLGVTF